MQAATDFFKALQRQSSAPSLIDNRAWHRLDRIERKAVLRLAGYNTGAIVSSRGDLQSLASKAWDDLPADAHHRIKKTAARLVAVLSSFSPEPSHRATSR